MKLHLGKCESRMDEINQVNQRKMISDKQLQRAETAMQTLNNMNHGRRGGASKRSVPRRELGNEEITLGRHQKVKLPQYLCNYHSVKMYQNRLYFGENVSATAALTCSVARGCGRGADENERCKNLYQKQFRRWSFLVFMHPVHTYAGRFRREERASGASAGICSEAPFEEWRERKSRFPSNGAETPPRAYESVILQDFRNPSAARLVRTLLSYPDSKCIVCHFCRLRRFEPRCATGRSKFQTENFALWPKEKSVSSE